MSTNATVLPTAVLGAKLYSLSPNLHDVEFSWIAEAGLARRSESSRAQSDSVQTISC
jgi:hypothetical protein